MRAPVIEPMLSSLPVDVSRTRRSRVWLRTLSEVPVRVDGRVYSVREGYEYDGASVPAVAWLTVGAPHEWPYVYAGAVHDACYTGDLHLGAGQYARPTWKPAPWAHAVFREILLACGVSRLRAWRCWLAVWLYWRCRGYRNYRSLDYWLSIYGSEHQ